MNFIDLVITNTYQDAQVDYEQRIKDALKRIKK